MTDRDRLIELFKKIEYTPFPEMTMKAKFENQFTDYALNSIADKLLANGVIVPPCDIGQTVYTRYGYSFKIERIEVLEDKKILFRCGNDGTDDYMAFYDFEIGTDVFLTKEEAEAKLEKRGKENV